MPDLHLLSLPFGYGLMPTDSVGSGGLHIPYRVANISIGGRLRASLWVFNIWQCMEGEIDFVYRVGRLCIGRVPVNGGGC